MGNNYTGVPMVSCNNEVAMVRGVIVIMWLTMGICGYGVAVVKKNGTTFICKHFGQGAAKLERSGAVGAPPP